MRDLKDQLEDYLNHVVGRLEADDIYEPRLGTAPVRTGQSTGDRDRLPTWAHGMAAAAAILLLVGVFWLFRNADVASPTPASDSQPGVTPINTLPELRRDGEFIVFEPRGSGPDWDLAAQDPETGEVRTLVETDGIADCQDYVHCTNFVKVAEWSSDGRWVAFTVAFVSLDLASLGPCGPTIGVWVKSALGDPRQLTAPCNGSPPSTARSKIQIEELWKWSPVGARLAYARVDEETDELFVIDASNGRRTSLGTADEDLIVLEWSPDGTQVAYADGASVFKVEVDGGERSLLADSFRDIIDIAWSPDGTQILVHDQGRYRMQVMNADGSNLHLLLEGEDACCETEWSPDGDRILYMLSVVRPGEPEFGRFDSEVWTVAPDGSNRIKIFDSDGCDMGVLSDALPVWAPNGTQVAYNDCGNWVVVNADGTNEAQPIDDLVHRSWYSGGLSGWDLARIGQVDH